MKDAVNGWVFLIVLVGLLCGYGFAWVQVSLQIPASAAQVAANQQLIGQVNQAFANNAKTLDTELAKIKTRLDTLEKQ